MKIKNGTNFKISNKFISLRFTVEKSARDIREMGIVNKETGTGIAKITNIIIDIHLFFFVLRNNIMENIIIIRIVVIISKLPEILDSKIHSICFFHIQCSLKIDFCQVFLDTH